jgi:hypothetical protein
MKVNRGQLKNQALTVLPTGRQEVVQYKEKIPLLASLSPLRALEAPPCGRKLQFPTPEFKTFE